MSNPAVKTTSGGPVAKKPKDAKDPNEVSTPHHDLTKQTNPTFSSSSAATASSGNVKVVCRVRPMNKKELEMGTGICVDFLDDQTIRVNTSQSAEAGAGAHKFVFDRVFKQSVTQEEIYEFAAKPVVNSVLEGFNGTVFAYGQTSSGKTHTMQGPSIDDAKMRGIIPRMVNTVFDHIGETPEHIEFTVKVSIVEIYLERIRDLLSPEKSNLKVREDKARGIYLEDVTESYVSDENEVYDIMKLGASNRAISATNMNEGSSRSHSIFMMTIHQNNLHELSAKTGKLYLVDLAGSEKVGKTGAAGQTLEEAKNINKSLSALGNVINALTDNKSHQHIPYRDSKLTRILQESLGGNARTTLIITCSPSPFNDQETLSTLRFGYRAKSIKNTPKINREFTVAELKLLLDKAESTLEQRERRIKVLESLLSSNGIAIPKEDQLNAIQMKAPEKATTRIKAIFISNPCINRRNCDSEEKVEENFSRKDLDNLEIMSRNDEQARIKLLESDLEMERNNVKIQTEKVNILRKEYANLSTKLSTSEKENEAMITKLADFQEIEQKFKDRDLEHEALSNLREALNAENDDLRKTNQELIERLEAKGEKVEMNANQRGQTEVVNVDELRDQMVKDMAAKFGINDEQALKAFASSYFDKFKLDVNTSTDKISAVSNVNDAGQISEELAREKEKNTKLQTDYQTLQFEYNRLVSEKAQKPEEVKANEENPQPEKEKVTGLKDLQARANKASKPEELTAEEKELKRKQAEEALRKQNMETLTNMYQQIAAQKAQPKAENPDSDKKVHRKTERILNLEKQLHETKDLVNQYKSKIESLKSLISTSNSSTTTASQLLPDSGESLKLRKEAIKQELRDSMPDSKNDKNWANTSISKIVKPIRGGQNKKSIGNTKVFLNVLKQSNVPQTSSGNEERKDEYNKYNNKIDEEEEGER